MTNEEKLLAYRDAMRELDKLGEELEECRARAESMTASYSLTPGGSGDGRRMEHHALKLAELGAEYARRLDELAAQRLEVGQIIDAVPDALTRAALRLRFLDGLTWKQTAEKLELTDTWTFKLWGRVRKAWRDAEQTATADRSTLLGPD